MHKRILAVGHDAYPAGSQIAFLTVLRWFHDNYAADISLLLRSGGALLDDYATLVPTTTLEPSPSLGPARLHRRRRNGRGIVRPGSVDLVYANSAATAVLATELAAKAGCPVVCHIHELEMSIRRFAPRFVDAIPAIDGFIAVSRAVERNLVTNHDIDPAIIDVIPPAVPLPGRTGTATEHGRLRAELNIPKDAFVVGGCGTLDWRKGPDVFLLVAKAVAAAAVARRLHFLWVGGEPEALELMQHDIYRMGLAQTVTFTGSQPDPAPYFELFDAFLLSSREDPYPLVCLEAAALGAPIVCFADAGGMPDFVEADAGYVVPYLDIDAAADRLLTMARLEKTRERLGRRAMKKVAERSGIDVTGPQISAVLDRHLHRTGAAPTVIATKERAGI